MARSLDRLNSLLDRYNVPTWITDDLGRQHPRTFLLEDILEETWIEGYDRGYDTGFDHGIEDSTDLRIDEAYDDGYHEGYIKAKQEQEKPK